MTTLTRHPEESSTAAAPARVLWIGWGVLAALVLTVFWDFFRSQYYYVLKFPSDWGHTVVIPLIAGYFVYLQREKLLRTSMRTTWLGLVPLLLGVFLYSAFIFGPDPILRHDFRAAALGISLFGIVLTVCGWAQMRYLWFPLVYLVAFGHTPSLKALEMVTFPLQDISAIGANVLLNLIGVESVRIGNLLVVDHGGVKHNLNVAEACSGMRMLVAFLALGVAIAWTSLRHFWQQALLVILGVPVAIFVNMLRVATLGLLTLYDANMAAGEFHHVVGLVWLMPAFLLYMGILWIIRHLVIDDGEAGVP